jgi:hypothetical protein
MPSRAASPDDVGSAPRGSSSSSNNPRSRFRGTPALSDFRHSGGQSSAPAARSFTRDEIALLMKEVEH